MEIIQERLEREFGLTIITTAPSVVYKVNTTNLEQVLIDNPALLPPESKIESIEEPMVKASIMVPSEFIGTIMELNQEKRGTFLNMDYLTETRVNLYYELPLSEIVYDYFDQLKSRTKGYASLDYELKGYKEAKLVKLDIMLNGEIVDALSFIVHRDKAYQRGRKLVEKLRGLIPRQMFEVPVQAVIGSKVIARETIRAMRKDVLAKCYGGDISRKRKLLEKQKEGKRRMKQVGNVEIPQDAFMAVLKMDD
jgi:GTP-binding protein LepA